MDSAVVWYGVRVAHLVEEAIKVGVVGGIVVHRHTLCNVRANLLHMAREDGEMLR